MGFRWIACATGLFLVQAGMACRGSPTAPPAPGSADQLASENPARSDVPGSAEAKAPPTPPEDPTTLPHGMIDIVHGPMKDLPAKTAPLSGPACRSLLARAAASASAAHIANGRCQADSECVASETGSCIAGCFTAVAKAKRKEHEQALGDIHDELCGPFWAGDCTKALPPIPVPSCPAPIPKCENGICEARY